MTDAQFKASDPACSVWLSAHAGTGKTKVLVDRVLRFLLQGAPPSSIICITYTKAAAMEMQLRIRKKLTEWVSADEKKLQKSLHSLLGRDALDQECTMARTLLCRLMDDCDGVRVQTIHSFCQSILASFPVEAGVTPHFQLMDERTSQELFQEARQRFLGDVATEGHDSQLMQALADVAAGVSDMGLQDIMKALAGQHRRIAELMRGASALIRLNTRLYHYWGMPYRTSAEDILHPQGGLYQAECKEQLLATVALLLAEKSKTVKALGQAIVSWFDSDGSPTAFGAYTKSFLKADGDKKTPRAFYTETFAKAHPQQAAWLDEEQERVYQLRERLEGARVARFSEAVLSIAEGVLSLFQALKREAGWLDYDDLIAHTLDLFRQDGMAAWVMVRMDQQFKHILIDEAQDTSPQQWLLTQYLIRELYDASVMESPRTLFVVGDEKQSIYSFQGADPRGFELWQRYYEAHFDQQGLPFEHLSLDMSFRSSQAVLEVVDACFPSSRHDVWRQGQAGQVELWPLVEKQKVETPVSWEVEEPLYFQESPVQRLCDNVATSIAGWLRDGRQLASQGRAVEAGDIMILLQKRKPLAKRLAAALMRAGIPVAGADRLKLNDHLAIQDVMALANWSLHPDDDLALACVLKGPWIGYSEDQLFELSYNRGEALLWQRLAESDAVSFDRLNEIRYQARSLSPHDWLFYLLEKLNGRIECKRRFGDEVDELFDELLNQSLVFESGHTPHLQSFVHWLHASDTEIKRELEQASGAVRIMTVHGAKGLQAPIVILPDTTRTPDAPRGVLWWDDMPDGESICFAQPVGSQSHKIRGIKDALKARDKEEYLRLLYVAMTRAEDELYVCGWEPSKASKQRSWYDVISGGLSTLESKQELEDGRIRLAYEQTAAVDVRKCEEKKRADVPPPIWLSQSARKESAPRILSPSLSYAGEEEHYGDGDGSELAIARGNLIHGLLQWLPKPEASFEKSVLFDMAHALAVSVEGLNIEVVVEEVWRIRQDRRFDTIFSKTSMAEVSLVGYVRGVGGESLPVSGQIDRLLIEDGVLHVVDFKSNRVVPQTPEDVPTAYIHQLWMYRALLAASYPDYSIKTSLLWTASPEWMVIPQELLDRYGECALDSLAA